MSESTTNTMYRPATPDEIAWSERAQNLKPGMPHSVSHEHHLPLGTVGFGGVAVAAALNDVDTFGPFVFKSDGQYVATGEPEDNNLYRVAAITMDREGLAELLPDDRYVADMLVGFDDNAPTWLRSIVGAEPRESPDGEHGPDRLVDRLCEKDEQGNYVVSDRTFLNVLEWHNHRLVREQRLFTEKREQYAADFDDAVRQAVADGWLPDVVLARLARVHDATVLVDDGFNTILRGRGGYKAQDPNSQQALVVLAPDYGYTEQMYRHENTHVIQGGRSRGSNSAYTSCAIARLFKHKDFASKAVIEALVEHVAGVLGGDELQDINPSEEKAAFSYPQHRTMLHYLCEGGAQKVDVRLFIASLMEDAETADALGDRSATAELGRQLEAAFPDADILNEVSELECIDDLYSFNTEKQVDRGVRLTTRT